MAYPPSTLASQGYTSLKDVPQYRKNLLTGVIEYS